jgi:predicted HAD superfamily Cof-like phosphohydrolase
MREAFEAVTEFMRAYGQYTPDKPCMPSLETLLLRRRLIREELNEYVNASMDGDIEAIADALADLAYVVLGAAAAHGLTRFPEIFSEVHAANMRKLGPDGKPLYRADGKVRKPDGWVAPDLGRFLR